MSQNTILELIGTTGTRLSITFFSCYSFLLPCAYITAVSDEFPSLLFQDNKKPKCYRRTERWTDEQCDNSIPQQRQFVGGIIISVAK